MEEITVPDPFQSYLNSRGNSGTDYLVQSQEEVTIHHPFEQFLNGKHSSPIENPPADKRFRYSISEPYEQETTNSESDDCEYLSIESISIPDFDIGDVEDIVQDDPSICEASKWDCFKDSFGEKLYPGSSVTKMQAITILTNWFSSYPGISKSAFNQLLNILHTHILPLGNKLPSGYSEAYKLLENLLSPTVEYHCCVNDCVLFRDKLADLRQCPKCFEPRYMSGSIPRKRFLYLPLEARLKRMFSQEATSKLFQNHLNDSPGTHVSSIHDTDIWKEWYSEQGIHKGDKKALSLGICVDGLNPFAKEKSNYSMWPIVVFPLNFPPGVRRISTSMFLVGIIPGPKEMKNIDPYMSIVVEDIQNLNGIEVYDAIDKCTFKMKANVCLHMLDYPGQNKLFHCHGAGAYSGCAYCCQVGEYCKALDKMVYLEHRRFLPASDPLRLDIVRFPIKQVCHQAAPKPKTQEYVDKENENYKMFDSLKARKGYVQKTGCVGSTPLSALPHHDRYLNTPVEPMHLVKGIAEHVIKLICGVEDSVKVRTEEKFRNRFPSCWLNDGTTNKIKSRNLPKAPFRLTNIDLKTVNERFVNICIPNGMEMKKTLTFGPSMHLKCVEWKHLMTEGILKYCLRGLLGSFQRKTLFELCDVLTELLAEQINPKYMDKLEYRTHRILCLLERDFPVSLHVIVVHLLHHLPMYIKRFGPAYNFHMYPLERFNSWISRRVLNRRFPESTVINTYRLFELSSFLSMSQLLPQNSVYHIDNAIQEDGVNSEWKCTLDEHIFSKLKLFYQSTASASEFSVENSVIKQKFVMLRDIHGRDIRYSHLPTPSGKSSCIVYFTIEKAITFGEVIGCFKHYHQDQVTMFVQVNCFKNWYKEHSPNLVYVLTTQKSSEDVVDVKLLSKPLVHSYEGDKLWILNAPLWLFK